MVRADCLPYRLFCVVRALRAVAVRLVFGELKYGRKIKKKNQMSKNEDTSKASFVSHLSELRQRLLSNIFQ